MWMRTKPRTVFCHRVFRACVLWRVLAFSVFLAVFSHIFAVYVFLGICSPSQVAKHHVASSVKSSTLVTPFMSTLVESEVSVVVAP